MDGIYALAASRTRDFQGPLLFGPCSPVTAVPAQHLGELSVAALAQEIITLHQELAELDALVNEKITEHRQAEVLLSMPGFGQVLAAELLGATGGDLTVFQTADRFAGIVGMRS